MSTYLKQFEEIRQALSSVEWRLKDNDPECTRPPEDIRQLHAALETLTDIVEALVKAQTPSPEADV